VCSFLAQPVNKKILMCWTAGAMGWVCKLVVRVGSGEEKVTHLHICVIQLHSTAVKVESTGADASRGGSNFVVDLYS